MRMRGWGWEDEDERMRMRGWGWEDEDERMRIRGWGWEDEDKRMKGWGWEDEDKDNLQYSESVREVCSCFCFIEEFQHTIHPVENKRNQTINYNYQENQKDRGRIIDKLTIHIEHERLIFQDLEGFSFTITLRQRSRKLHACFSRCIRGTPLVLCLRVIVNEKTLNLEKTSSSVLSVFLLFYGKNYQSALNIKKYKFMNPGKNRRTEKGW
jgi:hypothetical protein